jgi:hypothetical protein
MAQKYKPGDWMISEDRGCLTNLRGGMTVNQVLKRRRKGRKMKTRSESSSDPCVHTQNIRKMLTELVDHLRKDLDKVSEPKAQALFETSAEVLIGLRTAFEHYERGNEKGMRRGTLV